MNQPGKKIPLSASIISVMIISIVLNARLDGQPAGQPSGQGGAVLASPALPFSAPGPDSKALAASRAKLAALVGTAAFEDALTEAAAGLDPRDGAVLLEAFAPKAGSAAAASGHLVAAAGLRLLLRDFPEAAADYEGAAAGLEAAAAQSGGRNEGKVGELRLRAARMWLAAGESDKAGRLSARVLAAPADDPQADQARLVAAWSALFAGNSSSAKALAAGLLETSGQPPGRRVLAREARFLLWISGEGRERSEQADALIRDFANSPEARIASSSTPVSLAALPHWYFGSGFLAEQKLAPAATSAKAPSQAANSAQAAASTPAASLPAPPVQPADTASAPSLGERFQIGIFSREENAKALIAELGKKGFSARMEKRRVGEKDLLSVLVTSKDNGRNLGDRLKNAGYEAWPLFE
jgi:cell division septation protein DedD